MKDQQTQELQEVVAGLKEFLDSRPKRSEEHEAEHEFIKVLMQEYKARTAFWDSVTKKVVTTGVLATCSIVISALVYAATHFFKGV
jgi:hypothetical protein